MDPGRFLLGKYRRYAVCSLSLCGWTYARGTGYLGGNFNALKWLGLEQSFKGASARSRRHFYLSPQKHPVARMYSVPPWAVPWCIESSMMQVAMRGSSGAVPVLAELFFPVRTIRSSLSLGSAAVLPPGPPIKRHQPDRTGVAGTSTCMHYSTAHVLYR